MPHTVLGNYIWAVAPTILLGLLFWFTMRAIIRSDRTERKVAARIEAEERAKFAAERAKSNTSAP
jgi:flagellar biosynthesis/type III secretory pathway M-ring protein FliF/YscJ